VVSVFCPGGNDAGVAIEFYCEHTVSKSRVFALVKRPGYMPSLVAVLTCIDPLLAHRVAASLGEAATSGRGPTVLAESGRIAAELADAPAASYRQAIDRAYAAAWPVPGTSGIRWDDLHNSYGYPYSEDQPITPGGRDAVIRTPHEGDLTSLPGMVVRVETTLDLHIHDPERLLAAARADGWEPDQELDDTDPHDLLGASMWLADQIPTIPGADMIHASSAGENLSNESIGRTDTVGADALEDNLPDFAALFHVNDNDDADWQLTPRTADALHSALSILADEAYDDIEEHGDDPVQPDGHWMVFHRLPRLSWRQDAHWRRQLARAADDLANDLEAGEWPIPRCNAEELCLHLALADAVGCAEMRDESPRSEHLPRHDDDDDWDLCSEMLFQDHDVLLLNQPWADGIEDPDDDANKAAGIRDLRPNNWFETFNNVEPRDPKRGYRR
jgi:hypothetical protein